MSSSGYELMEWAKLLKVVSCSIDRIILTFGKWGRDKWFYLFYFDLENEGLFS